MRAEELASLLHSAREQNEAEAARASGAGTAVERLQACVGGGGDAAYEAFGMGERKRDRGSSDVAVCWRCGRSQ
eukprot:5066444-Pleurochrysis_carterae.AAC.4